MPLIKHGAGKITDKLDVSKDKKTGKKKVASVPIQPKDKSDGE